MSIAQGDCPVPPQTPSIERLKGWFCNTSELVYRLAYVQTLLQKCKQLGPKKCPDEELVCEHNILLKCCIGTLYGLISPVPWAVSSLSVIVRTVTRAQLRREEETLIGTTVQPREIFDWLHCAPSSTTSSRKILFDRDSFKLHSHGRQT